MIELLGVGILRHRPEPPSGLARCSGPACRGEAKMEYLGYPLCWKCWLKHCDADETSDAVMIVNDEAAYHE